MKAPVKPGYSPSLSQHAAIAQLSSIEMAGLAYIKAVDPKKGTGYALCSPDGRELAVFANRDLAFFTARVHDLQPVSVH